MPQKSPPPKKEDMGSVSNQNCCKGIRFTENVQKHCIMLRDCVLTLPDVFTVADIEHIITELCRLVELDFNLLCHKFVLLFCVLFPS